MIKIDLHTHSIMSKDGSITQNEYAAIIKKKTLDCVAITDHNTITLGQAMQKEYPTHIIVGEEIASAEGDIIGLFLKTVIAPGLSFSHTVKAIKEQHGLVLLPHPFSTGRQGVGGELIKQHKEQIDIIETFNPRNIIHDNNQRAKESAIIYNIPEVASSDSHCAAEIGKTYTEIAAMPTRETLINLLNKGTMQESYTTPWHLLCPKRNRIKKLLTPYVY